LDPLNPAVVSIMVDASICDAFVDNPMAIRPANVVKKVIKKTEIMNDILL